MNVCFFGIYDPGYARNRVLAEGFHRLGHRVIHCRVDPVAHRGIRKYLALYREYKRVCHEPFDQVIVCFPGHAVVWLARVFFGKRIIFDAFLSLYDSNVFDRKAYGRYSLGAMKDWLYDKTSCMLAGAVLLDTEAHIQYFNKTFGVPLSKCIRVWVGANDAVFYPRSVPEEHVFTVHFHGTFIPLQGLAYIMGAAEILKNEDIRFRIIGSGIESPMVEQMVREKELDHVTLLGRMSLEKVSDYMASAHIVLGIFGVSEKTRRAIPNKVYEAMAMGKAIITADTPALRELMPDGSAMAVVPVGDAESLAAMIQSLRGDGARRVRLGANARELFEARLLPEKIVTELLTVIPSRIGR